MVTATPDMTDHDPIDKKSLSERDICTKFITPAFKAATGWCDALEAQLKSAEEERGRHSAFEPRGSVLAGVGG